MKLIACAVAGLVLLSIFVGSCSSVRAEGAVPTLLAKLDLDNSEAFVFEGRIIDFNDDGSFYYLSYHQYTFGGGAYVRISLISADLNVQWHKDYNAAITWAVAPDGGLSVVGANSSYGGMHIFMYDRSGGERWASPYPRTYLNEARMAITSEGWVVVGEHDYLDENSTTATVFDEEGNYLDLNLPDELKNTTLPIMLKNGTLAAQCLDHLYGLSSDLQILWVLPLPQPIAIESADRSIVDGNITVIINGYEYIDGKWVNPGGVFCYDLNGELLWQYPSSPAEKYYNWLAARDSDGMVFFSSNPYYLSTANETLVALFPNGTLAWTYDLGAEINPMIFSYKDGVIVWNRTAFTAVDGEGNLSYTIVPDGLSNRPYGINLHVGLDDRIYITDTNNITAYGVYTEPQKPQDWSPFLLAPLLIAVVLVVVYIKGKGMKDNEE